MAANREGSSQDHTADAAVRFGRIAHVDRSMRYRSTKLCALGLNWVNGTTTFSSRGTARKAELLGGQEGTFPAAEARGAGELGAPFMVPPENKAEIACRLHRLRR